MRHPPIVLFITLAVLATTSCSDSATAPADRLDSLAGTVVNLDDATPVDGGATLWLTDDLDGQQRVAYVSSIFTNPPPDDDTLATFQRVMRVFREVEIGDHVVARGIFTASGLKMQDLAIR